MTKPELIRTVSRAFALYLLVWATVESTYFPQYVNSLIHRLNETRNLPDQSYWVRYYVLETASLTVRTFALLLGGLVCWNPGPRIIGIFSPPDIETKDI